MLSRVADSSYWMSRNIERAENIARILEVYLQLMLDLQKMDNKKMSGFWEPVLQSTGDYEDFLKLYPEITTAAVVDFLAFHPQNLNSIQSCINSARENARQIREQISNEMWEELNRTYLSLKGQTLKKVWKQGPYDFFREIRRASHLFQGITDATMPHNEGWDFIQVGKYLERADKTTRILDVHHQILVPRSHGAEHVVDTVHLTAVLESCSAHQAYRKVYVAQVEPWKVAEFLVLNENFPRSIRFCVKSLDERLRRISGCKEEHYTNLTEKLSGRLVSELNFSSIDDVFHRGIHEYMDDLQTKFNEIGEAIYQNYMFYPSRDLEMEIRQQQTTQQQ